MQEQEKHSAKDKQLWKLTKSYKQAYEPDVSKGLIQLKHRIAQEKTSTSTQVITLKTWLSRAAAIIVVLVSSTIAYQTFFNGSPAIQTLQATTDVVNAYKLPDGSEIWLNKNSQLSFPEVFDANQRLVTLQGEAFFKIAKDANRPFIVTTKAISVQVLGTAFNLRAYETDDITAVKVLEGEVAFKATNTGAETVLRANEKAAFHKKQQTISQIPEKSWQDTAWMPKNLDFDNTPIAEIISYLATNFKISVELEHPSLGDCTLLATLVDNNPDAIIKSIKRTFPVELEVISSKEYKLTGNCQTD